MEVGEKAKFSIIGNSDLIYCIRQLLDQFCPGESLKLEGPDKVPRVYYWSLPNMRHYYAGGGLKVSRPDLDALPVYVLYAKGHNLILKRNK